MDEMLGRPCDFCPQLKTCENTECKIFLKWVECGIEIKSKKELAAFKRHSVKKEKVQRSVKKYYTIKECSEQTGLSIETIKFYVSCGKIKPKKVGNYKYFSHAQMVSLCE